MIGASTGEIHGTGIKNSKSSVRNEAGQLIKILSHT